ncbi:MAG: hypothetical protein GDA48_03030 [Hormoscilla sp. GM102CHS1]|nr:hypothetical protein [Hormoscilla sp. GM102CHS1]
MSLRNCNAGHCSGTDSELNSVCKQEGWAIGHPVITRDGQGPCQCHCSCLALGTPVGATLGVNKNIENFNVGDTVIAAGVDLKWGNVEVRYSNGTASGVQPGTIFVEYVGGQLIVTPDHLFLLPDKKLKRAEKLSISDQLVGADGNPVDINRVSAGTYVGGFHHIATQAILSATAIPSLRTSDPELKLRLNACYSCSNRVSAPNQGIYKLSKMAMGTDICRLCGCHIETKARLAREQCPAPDESNPGFNRWRQAIQ